jgi:hypothetical protein
MQSNSQSDDAQNGSFGAADRPLQNLKPGFEAVKAKRKEERGRRVPSKAKDVPRKSLAQRIREREGK